MTPLLSEERSSYSLQFFSSDWSSQSNSPSHLQPALMHIPLLHMNSTDLQGWWEAAHTEEHQKHVTAGKNVATFQAGLWFLPVRLDYVMSLLSFCGDAFYLKLRYISAQVDRDQCSNVGPEYNYSIQHTIEN